MKNLKKISIVISAAMMALSLIAGCITVVSRMQVGQYKKITAEEKNAYITNRDVSTTPPTLFVAFDYSEDRYIIGRLPVSEYKDSLQEGDWVSIWYDVEFPRTITQKNPYYKHNCFIAGEIALFVAGLIYCLVAALTGKKKEE
ncbi:MAG: hypothetical protein MJ188_06145 [Treponema sp.]|nr:hypothetical protein [Treponema sp.]